MTDASRPRRLLVTGSRTWADSEGYAERLVLLKSALRTALHELCPTRPAPGQEPVLVHGGARGADMLAADYWEQWGLPTEMHRANWPECGDGCPPDLSCRKTRRGREYCNRAGFRRDVGMVALGADRCVSLIHNESRGATMTADLAEQAGIPTTRIRYPEGTST